MAVTMHTIALSITNSYLLVGTDDAAVLIDAGLPGTERHLKAGLAKVGVEPTAIQLVVLTHGHLDHCGSAAAIREMTGAEVAVHTSDANGVETGRKVKPPGLTTWGRVLRVPFGGLLRIMKLPPCPVDVRIDDDGLDLFTYGVSGRVIHTPGHSPGSLTVLTEDGAAYVGDMAMNGLPLTLKAGLPIFGDQPEQMTDAWRRILDGRAESIYPAHGKPFPAEVMLSRLGLA